MSKTVTINGAITSPALLASFYKQAQQINPAGYLIMRFIVETGQFISTALKLTVRDMDTILSSRMYNLDSKFAKELKAFGENRLPNEKFFSYNDIPLTSTSCRTIFFKISDKVPPYLLTSLALRKTFYWNIYINSTKKYKIMRQLQLESLDEVAQYFDVPLSAISDKRDASVKASLLTNNDVPAIISKTKDILDNIEATYMDTLLPESYYHALRKYVDSLDTINSCFTSDIEDIQR